MLPIFLSPEISKKNILDLCAAPGGKLFQAISKGSATHANDINANKIEILKSNLKRLKFNSNSDTIITTPLIDGNKIRLQHGTSDRFLTGDTRNTSVVLLHSFLHQIQTEILTLMAYHTLNISSGRF